MSIHYIIKCSCGKVIDECRCRDDDKTIHVTDNGCVDCKGSTTKAKPAKKRTKTK